MTSPFSAKPLRVSIATALALGSLATPPAFAQFNTSGTYAATVPSGQTVTSPAGNTESLAIFTTAVSTAFGSNKGGDITFDNTTFTAAPSFTATYGTGQTNSLTVTDILLAGATGTFGPGTDAANATSGTNYIGFAGASGPPYNFNFSFSQNLSDVGIMVINRGAARSLTFTVTLDNGSVVTPNQSAIATSNGGPTFFEYAPTGGRTVSAINFATPDGLTRFDDLGFIVAPTAAPEPSQIAGLGLGVLGVGLLALRARKRTVLGN
jgi:hypothetical protein